MSGIDAGAGGVLIDPSGSDVTPTNPLPVIDALSTTGVGTLLAVGVVAVKAQVGGAPLANRKGIYLNPQSANIRMGFAAGVTTVNGIQLANGAVVYVPADETAEVWLIRTIAGGSCAVWEVA